MSSHKFDLAADGGKRGGALVNICLPEHESDPHFRYQRPQANVKHESSGNGKRTMFSNIGAVSDFMFKGGKRSYPKVVQRWIQRDLNSSVKMMNNNRGLMIKGTIAKSDVEKSLKKFSWLFLLCPKCHYPELDYALSGKGKKRSLAVECRACPYSGTLGKKARQHQVAKYFQNTIASLKDTKKPGPKPENPRPVVEEKEEVRPAGADGEELVWSFPVEADDGFETRTDDDAVRRRFEEANIGGGLTSQVQLHSSLLSDGTDGRSSGTSSQKKEKLIVDALQSGDPDECVQILKSYGDDSRKAMDTLMKALQNLRSCSFEHAVTNNASVWALYLCENEQMKLMFLEKLAKVCTTSRAVTSFDVAASLCSALYDKDVIDEDDILTWYDKCTDENIKENTKMKIFVNWLQSAEEESSEDESP